MSRQPINYMIDVVNPIERAFQGYQKSAAIREDIKKQQAQRAAMQRQQQMRKDLAESPIDLESVRRLRATYPELKNLDEIYKDLSEEQRQNKAGRLAGIYTALESNEIDFAKNEIQTNINAAKNSGDVKEIKRNEMLMQLIERSPEAAKKAILMEGEAVTGGKFSDVYEGITKRKEQETKEGIQERETRVKEGTLKLNEDRLTFEKEKQIINQAQEAAKKANTAKEKKLAQENIYFKQFDPKVKRFNEIMTANQKLISALNKGTAAGDLAGIFQFMKINDPGSTVRESEFKTAEQAKGWLGRMDEEGRIVPAGVRQAIDRLVSGTLLQPEQRQDFLDTAKLLYQPEVDAFKSDYLRFKTIVDNQNLDPKNIFGNITEQSFDSLTDTGYTESELDDAMKMYGD